MFVRDEVSIIFFFDHYNGNGKGVDGDDTNLHNFLSNSYFNHKNIESHSLTYWLY